MEQIKRRFANEIAARLSAAAESDAKSEMIEELAENLAGRYEDMTAAGVGAEEAFARAMDELGDPEELVDYLNSLDPEEGSPGTGGQDDMDTFFQSVGDLVRDTANVGRQAARAAKDILKTASDAVRSGATAYVHVDGDGWMDRQVPSGDLRALDIGTTNGDVDIFLSEGENDPIRIEGNVDKLEIYTMEAGVLTVRERPTAIGQLFTVRGLTSADVSLSIPARRWESIRIATANGDVDMGDELEVGQLDVRTASGDLDCRVRSCDTLRFKSASGDMDCSGNVVDLAAETVSGDVELRGPIGTAAVVTVSGDIELHGSLVRAEVRSMSGDIQADSMTLPTELTLSSKSGDVKVRVPDTGPFSVRLHTVSGEVRNDFPSSWSEDGAGDGSRPRYTLSSVSGDVTIKAV